MFMYNVVALITCCVLFNSPGDQIGTTACDYMSFKQRIMVDDYDQAHIAWTWIDYPGQTQRYGMLTFRFTDVGYYSFAATPSWSGHVLLDITRDANPDMQRTIITYQYDAGGGYWSWLDIDMGNCWGAFPNDPKTIAIDDHLWPMLAAVKNGNLVMATGDYAGDFHHLYLSINEGTNWSLLADFDSCATWSHFVRSSHNSEKVVYTHTQFITDSAGSGQLDNDVYYMLSTDGGATWGPHTNITKYQPIDTVRAYADVCACFDNNDNLHIVWSGRKVDSVYHMASKIFHWDEVHDSITVVSSPSIYYSEPGGWWINGSTGAWRMPVDHPQILADYTTGILYCLWHGNDDTTDVSAGGYMNGELYGSYSIDGGLTWSDYVNLTNTRSPGAGPGACEDEDCMTATPFVVNDSIFITFLEDKDAGWYAQAEGVLTENPVYCWVFPTSLIRTGMEEHWTEKPDATSLQVAPNPFVKLINISLSKEHGAEGMELKIYDASGRVVKSFPRLTPYALRTTLCWQGNDQSGHTVPAGVYFITLTSAGQSNTIKVVKLE